MKRLNDISLELQNVAPHLADIARAETFRVPVGYFKQLPDNILERCREEDELAQAAPTLFSLKKTPVFDAPTGYFDLLYDETIQKNTDTPQLNRIAQIQTLNVPTSYFDQLHDAVLTQIRTIAQDSADMTQNYNNDEDPITPKLADIAKDNPFAIPQNYFEQLHERVFTKAINSDNNAHEYPQLDNATAHSPFAVPQNYFEQLHNNILQSTKKNQGGRLIEMKSQQSKLQLIVRYLTSAAAVITVFVAGYQLLNYNQTTNSQASEASVIPMQELMAILNDVPPNDIKAYVFGKPDEFAEFLEDPQLLNGFDVKNLSASDLIADISDKDIRAYFNSNADEFDDLLEDQLSDVKLDGIDLNNLDLDGIDLKDMP